MTYEDIFTPAEKCEQCGYTEEVDKTFEYPNEWQCPECGSPHSSATTLELEGRNEAHGENDWGLEEVKR